MMCNASQNNIIRWCELGRHTLNQTMCARFALRRSLNDFRSTSRMMRPLTQLPTLNRKPLRCMSSTPTRPSISAPTSTKAPSQVERVTVPPTLAPTLSLCRFCAPSGEECSDQAGCKAWALGSLAARCRGPRNVPMESVAPAAVASPFGRWEHAGKRRLLLGTAFLVKFSSTRGCLGALSWLLKARARLAVRQVLPWPSCTSFRTFHAWVSTSLAFFAPGSSARSCCSSCRFREARARLDLLRLVLVGNVSSWMCFSSPSS